MNQFSRAHYGPVLLRDLNTDLWMNTWLKRTLADCLKRQRVVTRWTIRRSSWAHCWHAQHTSDYYNHKQYHPVLPNCTRCFGVRWKVHSTRRSYSINTSAIPVSSKFCSQLFPPSVAIVSAVNYWTRMPFVFLSFSMQKVTKITRANDNKM